MKVTIPTSLQEITIAQWLQFQKVITPEIDEDTIAVFLVAIFCKITPEQALSINSKEFKEIVQTISNTIQSKPKFNQRFTFNNIEYGMIPNLDKMTSGEYIDLDKNYKTDIVKFMSVLFRPIKDKVFDTYLIEDYKGTNANLLNSPIENYLGAEVFFSSLKSELLTATNLYLQQLNPADKEVLDSTLAKNGGGIKVFTQLLTEMSLTLKKQLN